MSLSYYLSTTSSCTAIAHTPRDAAPARRTSPMFCIQIRKLHPRILKLLPHARKALVIPVADGGRAGGPVGGAEDAVGHDGLEGFDEAEGFEDRAADSEDVKCDLSHSILVIPRTQLPHLLYGIDQGIGGKNQPAAQPPPGR